MTRPAAQTATGSQAARPTSADLVRWRSLDAFQALHILADYVKEDETFKPTQASSTRRVHATAAGADWELLVDGPKFFDTRASTGGGGAVDLVMHLWRVPFKKAVIMLRRFDFNSPIQLV
jgi:hypothetical protein